MAERLSAITLYLLWEEIKRTCHGWLDQGRSVGVYAEELSHLSGTGGEGTTDVVNELFDKGRSFGVQLCLATQRRDQLPLRTQSAVGSFKTRLYMTTEHLGECQRAAADLNGSHELGASEPRDIRELPTGIATVRMRFAGRAQPSFTVTVDDFRAGTSSAGGALAGSTPAQPRVLATPRRCTHDRRQGHT